MSQLVRQDGLNSRIKGAAAELQVAQKLLLLGNKVAKPLVDDGFDYLVLIEEKWERVQVKLAGMHCSSKEYRYCKLDLTSGRKNYKEYCLNFDLLAIVFEDKFWLIPSDKIKGRYLVLTKNYNNYLVPNSRVLGSSPSWGAK